MTIRETLKAFIDGDTSFEVVNGVCIIFDTVTHRVCSRYSRYIELATELLDDLNTIRRE